jgi:hypothetical protein
MLGNQPTMPTQQRSGRDKSVAATRGREQPGERREDRSVGPAQLGLGVLLRSTVTSWRRTSSSASFDADDRANNSIQANSRMKIKYSRRVDMGHDRSGPRAVRQTTRPR